MSPLLLRQPTPPPNPAVDPETGAAPREVYWSLAENGVFSHHVAVHRNAPAPRIHIRGQGTLQLPAAPEHYELLSSASPDALSLVGEEWTAWFRRYLRFVKSWLGESNLAFDDPRVDFQDGSKPYFPIDHIPKEPAPIARILLILPGTFSGGSVYFPTVDESTCPLIPVDIMSREASVVSFVWATDRTALAFNRLTGGYFLSFSGYIYRKETRKEQITPSIAPSIHARSCKLAKLRNSISGWIESSGPGHLCWTLQKTYTPEALLTVNAGSHSIFESADFEVLAALEYLRRSDGLCFGIYVVNWACFLITQEDKKTFYRTRPTAYIGVGLGGLFEPIKAFRLPMPFQWPWPFSLLEESVKSIKCSKTLGSYTSIMLWRYHDVVQTLQLITGGNANMGLFLSPTMWVHQDIFPGRASAVKTMCKSTVRDALRLFLESLLLGAEFDVENEEDGVLALQREVPNDLSLYTSLAVSTRIVNTEDYLDCLEDDMLANEEAGRAFIEDGDFEEFSWYERLSMVQKMYRDNFEKATAFLKLVIPKWVPAEMREDCRKHLLWIGYGPCIAKGALDGQLHSKGNKKKKKKKKKKPTNDGNNDNDVRRCPHIPVKQAKKTKGGAGESHTPAIKPADNVQRDGDIYIEEQKVAIPGKEANELHKSDTDTLQHGLDTTYTLCPDKARLRPLMEDTGDVSLSNADGPRQNQDMESFTESTGPSEGKEKEAPADRKPCPAQAMDETVEAPGMQNNNAIIEQKRAGTLEEARLEYMLDGVRKEELKELQERYQEAEDQKQQLIIQRDKLQRELADFCTQKNKMQQLKTERDKLKATTIDQGKKIAELSGANTKMQNKYQSERDRAENLAIRLKASNQEEMKSLRREIQELQQAKVQADRQHAHRVKSLEKENQELQQSKARAEEATASREKKITALEKSLEKAEDKLSKEVISRKKAEEQLTVMGQPNEGDKAELEKTQREMKDQIKKKDQQIEDYKGRLEKTQNEVKDQIKKKDQQIEDYKGRLEKTQSEVKNLIRKRDEQKKYHDAQLKKTRDEAKEDIRREWRQRVLKDQEIEGLKAELQKTRSEDQEMRSAFHHLQGEVSNYQQERGHMIAEIQQGRAAVVNLQQAMESCKKKELKLNKLLKAAEQKAATVRELEQTNEGLLQEMGGLRDYIGKVEKEAAKVREDNNALEEVNKEQCQKNSDLQDSLEMMEKELAENKRAENDVDVVNGISAAHLEEKKRLDCGCQESSCLADPQIERSPKEQSMIEWLRDSVIPDLQKQANDAREGEAKANELIRQEVQNLRAEEIREKDEKIRTLTDERAWMEEKFAEIRNAMTGMTPKTDALALETLITEKIATYKAKIETAQDETKTLEKTLEIFRREPDHGSM